MANKLDTVLDNLQTALAPLVTDGHLQAVVRRLVQPRTEPVLPVLGLVLSRMQRAQGKIWVGTALGMLAARKGAASGDQTVSDLIARAADAIETARDAGSLGGAVDTPVWDTWYQAHNADEPLALVGGLASFRVRVGTPLLDRDEGDP